MQFTHPGLVRSLVVAAIVTAAPFAQSQTFSSGSTGAEGPLNLTTPGTIIFDPGALGLKPAVENVFNFTTINIGAGVTVKLTSKKLTGPVYWLATGDVTIAGIVDVSGDNGHPFTSNVSERIPAAGGAGGYNGGVGGNQSAGFPSAQPGNGPGGGTGTIVSPSGKTCGAGGSFTGSQFLIPLVGGSGGSGGSLTGSFGAGGGGGGGAILIASSTAIRQSSSAAQILAQGGWGGASAGCQNAGDGGIGSGGAIRLIAPYVNGGSLSAYGGNSGPNGYTGNGVIRVEAYNVGDFNNLGGQFVRSTPFSPGVPVTPPSSIKVISLVTGSGTIPINANPFSFPDATINTLAPVTVNVQAQYIPVGTVPKIIAMFETGPDQTVNCSPLAGTLPTSTCSAQITFPTGGSRGFVKATW